MFTIYYVHLFVSQVAMTTTMVSYYTKHFIHKLLVL